MIKRALLIFLTCFTLVSAHGKDSLEWYFASDLERDDAGVSWTVAQNSCKNGWHLPDKFEVSWFLNQKYDLKTRNGEPLCFWSSLYAIKPSRLMYYACEGERLKAGTYSEKRKANVVCFKDRYQNENSFDNGKSFYGPIDDISSKKYPGCVNNKVFVNYYKTLTQCNNGKREKLERFYPVSDSVSTSIDSTVYSLQHIPPCTESLQDKVYMIRDYSLFGCANHNWHSLGYLKKNKNHLDSLTYLNEKYRLVDITPKNDSQHTIWFLDNLKKESPGSSCYENKKENCSKYGVLYKSFEKELCPQGWNLPRQSDWNGLFEIYGLNGTELTFFDLQPAGLYEKLKNPDYKEKYAFSGLGQKTGWWSFDNDNRLLAIVFDGKKFSHTYATEGHKYYVRCVKYN